VRDILTLADSESLAETAAEIFIASAHAAIRKRGRFTASLTGGETASRLYSLLAEPEYAGRIDWIRTLLTFTDERCVPPEDPESNYRQATETLLGRVPVPEDQVFRIRGEISNPSRAAHFYEETLRELFPGKPGPRHDLLLLEIGEDGHTASLFPGTDALEDGDRWVAANYVPALGSWRITLTPQALGSARQVLFLVSGVEKASVAAEAFGGLPHETPHPCELVIPADGQCEILIDLAAAAGIPPRV
jgi:6-phosphogluconolactonase